ncbi:hypothetical protein TYRP_011500 [Tyrophagus putrescentiae]|nr:hypothetical protein TYRP_011500 [Tyrophagus putrescentiae]
MENRRPRDWTLARSLAGQLRFTCRQSLRLLIQTATPLRQSLDYYRRYFATIEQPVYSLLLAYFAVFNLFHFFAPCRFATRIVLGDVVAALALDAQFNFIFTLLSLYSIFINWQMYFMVNQKNTAFLKSVFQCLPDESSNQAVSPASFAAAAAADRKNSNQSTTTTTNSNQTKAVLNQQHCILMQRFVLLAINALQVFVLITDLCLLVFTPMVVGTWLRTQEFITFEQATLGVESQDGDQSEWKLLAHGIILFAVIGTTALTAIFLVFAEHYACLAKALTAVMSSNSKNKNKFSKKQAQKEEEAQLVGLLRQNAGLFHQLVFEGIVFYSGNFFLYMVLHVPIAAIFSMEVLFNRHQTGVDINEGSSSSGGAVGFSRAVMGGIVCEAVVGTFLIHLYCAYYSRYLHRGGRMLVKWCGTNGNGNAVNLSPRAQILVWLHLQRLVVRNQYGLTYGGLGLISLGSFFKFVLFFGELLMTSYGLVH